MDIYVVLMQSAPIVAVFYAFYFLATNFILLSLIVAAVLEQYSARDSEKRALQRRQAIRRVANTQVGKSAHWRAAHCRRSLQYDCNAFAGLADDVRIRLLLYLICIVNQHQNGVKPVFAPQIDRDAFVRLAEQVRIRLLLYFRWIIYSEEEALMASKYLRFLALLEEREQQLLMPAAVQVSLVSFSPTNVDVINVD